MTHALGGAHAKIGRAKRYLVSLDRQAAHYLRLGPINVETREERDGQRRHIIWVATASPEPPAELGLIVGVWAHNVRGVLDYLVYELVRRDTGEEDPRWTQFPIVVEPARYQNEADRRLRGVPAWSLPIFEGLQPFHDGEEAAFHPLAVLAEISNRDKHRLLHTAAMQISGSQGRVSGTSMVAIHRLEQNPGSAIGERVILDALIDTDGDDFNLELDIQVNVALEGYEFPIVPLLTTITYEVESIVEWFTPVLD